MFEKRVTKCEMLAACWEAVNGYSQLDNSERERTVEIIDKAIRIAFYDFTPFAADEKKPIEKKSRH